MPRSNPHPRLDGATTDCLIRLSDPEFGGGQSCPQLNRVQAQNLFHAATAHGVLSTVYRNIEEWGRVGALAQAGPGEALLEESKRNRAGAIADIARNVKLKHWGERVVEELRSRRVDCAIVKGPVFADRLYPRPECRLYSDIDIVIASGTVAETFEILGGLGLRQVGELAPGIGADCEYKWVLADDPDVFIELQTNLVHSRRLRGGTSVDLTTIADAGGGNPEDATALLFVAAVHTAIGHQFDRIVQLRDVVQLARQRAGAIDRDRLAAVSEKAGALLAVASGLAVAGRTLDCDACLELARSLTPGLRRGIWSIVPPSSVLAAQSRSAWRASWRRQLFRFLVAGLPISADRKPDEAGAERPASADADKPDTEPPGVLSPPGAPVIVGRALPGVSCLCLTYGRTPMLEEAMYSFLHQDYAGPKELVVLNDLDAQTLSFDHPEVRIINAEQRFNTLGEKRNATCDIARFDIFCVWDDDDIYLPHRLGWSAEGILNGLAFVKPSKALYWNNGTISSVGENIFHAQSCFSRQLFDRIGRYTAMNSGQDQEFESRLPSDDSVLLCDIDLRDLFYIYRWGGVEHHLSAFGTDAAGGRDGYLEVDRRVRADMMSGKLPRGEVVLKPHWKHDYLGIAQNVLMS